MAECDSLQRNGINGDKHGESFFQKFVMRTTNKTVKKSPSQLSAKNIAQPRPGLLTTLFGNSMQMFKKKQDQTTLDGAASYALVRTSQYEEGNDFEECNEILLPTVQSPVQPTNGNGTNNIYRPPRSYHHRITTSTHTELFTDLPKHALKSEVRVLSAPSSKHPNQIKYPPTPPKFGNRRHTDKNFADRIPSSSNKMLNTNGAPSRKISAPVGSTMTSSHDQKQTTKKISMIGTAPTYRKPYANKNIDN